MTANSGWFVYEFIKDKVTSSLNCYDSEVLFRNNPKHIVSLF